MQIAKNIVLIIVTITIVVYLISQCRKPQGWLGRFFAWEMGNRHSSLSDWGLGHIAIEKDHVTLDAGCGGGRTVSKLAAVASEGKTYGIDYSAACVVASRRQNKESILAGHVEIQQASVSKLPFADYTFDLVTAIETHYYWPDLVTDLQEILRVLKPGGKLVIIAEAYKHARFDQATQIVMKLLGATYLSAAEHRELFTTAGFAKVEIFEEHSKGWICAVGLKAPNHAS